MTVDLQKSFATSDAQLFTIVGLLPLATVPFPPFLSELGRLSELDPGLLLSTLLFLFPVLQPWTAPFAERSEKKVKIWKIFVRSNHKTQTEMQPQTYRLYKFAILD